MTAPFVLKDAGDGSFVIVKNEALDATRSECPRRRLILRRRIAKRVSSLQKISNGSPI